MADHSEQISKEAVSFLVLLDFFKIKQYRLINCNFKIAVSVSPLCNLVHYDNFSCKILVQNT
jgi:hypothetical protein